MDLKKIHNAVDNFSSKCVVVVGDPILDLYEDVRSSGRVNPENDGGVVFNHVGYEMRLGGALNTAANVAKLSGKIYFLGVMGSDVSKEVNFTEFNSYAVSYLGDMCYCIINQNRKMTVKKRMINVSNNQIINRIDRETNEYISADEEKSLMQKLRRIARNDVIDIVVFSDYAKGVLTPSLSRNMIDFCNQNSIPVIVDPKKSWEPYLGSSVLKPNRGELFSFTSELKTATIEDRLKCLYDKLEGMTSILVTLGDEGMMIYDKDGVRKIFSRKSEIIDVTGAGDTVTAALALGYASGLSLFESAEIANIAASIVVRKSRTSTVSYEELMMEFARN